MDEHTWSAKCIDDHEIRLRHLEANNKEQAKLFVMSEKLEGQIKALDEKIDTRFRLIEKFVDKEISVHDTKKEGKGDFFSIIALIISVSTFIILLFKIM